MLDLNRLRDQFSEFQSFQSREEQLSAIRLARALEVLKVCGSQWESLKDNPGTVARRLVAGVRESPTTVRACGPRPTPITVVATDGSQIYPDRNIEPTFYLLNISRIAFHYGTYERPLMESVPQLRYRSADLEGIFDDLVESVTREVVSAVRDELELSELLNTTRAVRFSGRPLVGIIDGTLIRWMVRGMRNPVIEQRLIERYASLLQAFRTDGIPLCSYISLPANTEVVNLLRYMSGEDDQVDCLPEESLQGLTDRKIFQATLKPGERSAVFESASHIQREYEASDRICYFYVKIPLAYGGNEVGRVEFPQWVAEHEENLDLVHSVVVSECEKGGGYPMILSEAHEKAVVRNAEKELFYQIVEREVTTHGLVFSASRKSLSKRRPSV